MFLFLACHFRLVSLFFPRHLFFVFALLALEFLLLPQQFSFLFVLLTLQGMFVLLCLPFHSVPLFLSLPLHLHFLFFGFLGGFIRCVCKGRQWCEE